MHCLNALRRLVSLCCLAACVAASDEACEAPMTLSSFAHALNEKFIAKVGEGRAREFRPELLPARVADSSLELHLVEPSSERFFTYASDNGWNNQLLNLLCGLDMARSLNRTLIVPPFSWPRRRGPAKVRRLAAAVPSRSPLLPPLSSTHQRQCTASLVPPALYRQPFAASPAPPLPPCTTSCHVACACTALHR
uniref:Uncharacterized protein n=1 Tax=Emiliania huxleyi TaxID=2903 RepID=A0A7S3SUB8_EMIHU